MVKETKTEETVETVKKDEYDKVVTAYKRLTAAYNKLLSMVASDYAERLSRLIFEEVDKAAS